MTEIFVIIVSFISMLAFWQSITILLSRFTQCDLDAPVKLHDDRLFTAASRISSRFWPHDLTVCILVGSLTVRVSRRCWAQSVASFQFRLIKELIDVKNFLASKRLR